MIDIFGPETQGLRRLITEPSDLRAEDVPAVADAWKRISSEERAAAWSAIQRGTDTQERITIQNAALVARHQALIVSQARGLREAGFSSAASDAAAAPIHPDGRTYDGPTYRVPTFSMATTLSCLLEGEKRPAVPRQRGVIERGAGDERARTSHSGGRR